MSGNCFQHCHLLLRAIQISWRAQTIIELTTPTRPLIPRLPVPIDDLLHISLCSMHYFRLINCLINARLLQVLWVLRVNILHQQQQKLNTLCLKLRRTDRETGKQRDRQTDARTYRETGEWTDRETNEDRQTYWVTARTSVLLLSSTRARDVLIISAHCVARVAQR